MVHQYNSPTQPFFKKKPLILITSILAIGLTALVVIWLNLSWRPDVASLPPDSGFYAYYGKAILNSQIPYRDLWDNKPPLGYYLNALGMLIFGQTSWGVWWSSVVWILGCTILLFLLLRNLFGKPTAGVTSAIFLVALMNPEIFQGGNMMEVYSLLPQIGVIGITYLFFTKNRNIWFAILAGVITTSSILIKQPTIILGSASILVMTISSMSDKKFREAFRTIMGFFLGFVSPLVLVCVYWLAVGALGQFIEQVLLQGVSYIGGSGSSLKDYFFYTLVNVLPKLLIGKLFLIAMIGGCFILIEKLVQFWWKPVLTARLTPIEWCMLIVFASIALISRLIWPKAYFGKSLVVSIFLFGLFFLIKFYLIRPRPVIQPVFSPTEWTWLVALVALPFEVVMVSLGGRYFGHYFITILPALMLAIVYPIWRAGSALNKSLKSIKVLQKNAIYLVLTICTLVWGAFSIDRVLPSAVVRKDIGGIFRGQIPLNELEQYIVQTTKPDDEVLVWHIHLGINFVTDRKAPSRFLFPLNLFIPASAQNTKLEQYIDGLEINPPELIIVQKPSSLSIPFVDDPIDQICKPWCAAEFEQAIQVPEIRQEWLRLQQFFNSHYVLDQRIYDWTVYRKLP